MERSNRSYNSKSLFESVLFRLSSKRPQNLDFHPKMLFFLLAKSISYSLLYKPWSNISWKTSLMSLARWLSHTSGWFNHMASCFYIWIQNSNFPVKRTIQFYNRKCFPAIYYRFHITGLLNKKNPQKVSGSPSIDPRCTIRKRGEWLWSMFDFVQITLKWKERIVIRTPSPFLGHLYWFRREKTPKTRFSPKNGTSSHRERRPVESNLSATR